MLLDEQQKIDDRVIGFDSDPDDDDAEEDFDKKYMKYKAKYLRLKKSL